MTDTYEKIKEIEEEISGTPYNKATQHHIGKLKAKLSQLRKSLLKKGGGKGVGYGVKKTGHATAILVGPPSVGKSTLLNKLTNAESPVGEYEFTTINVIPGMMNLGGVKIQLLDIPGLITEASRGKGKGREVLSIVRAADLILIILDIDRIGELAKITEELYNAGIRLDQKPSNISIKKTQRGGITVNTPLKLKKIDEETIRGILNTFGVHNAEVNMGEDVSEDKFIDAIARDRVYIPSLILLNKIDLANEEKMGEMIDALDSDFISISATHESNLDYLKEKMLESINVIRVFLRPQGGKADMDEPLILPTGSNVKDVCQMLHKDFKEKFRYARVWGKTAKHEGQLVGLKYRLHDGDVLTIIKKN